MFDVVIESQMPLVWSMRFESGLAAQHDQGEESHCHRLERAHGRSCVVAQLFSVL